MKKSAWRICNMMGKNPQRDDNHPGLKIDKKVKSFLMKTPNKNYLTSKRIEREKCLVFNSLESLLEWKDLFDKIKNLVQGLINMKHLQ